MPGARGYRRAMSPGPAPRAAARALLALLACPLALGSLAGCRAAPPEEPADVVVQPTPSVTRSLPPAPSPPPEPSPAPEPESEPEPEPADPSAEAEDVVVALANEAREAAGLAPLERSADLDAVARAWSVALATEGRDLAHNPDFSRQIPGGWSVSGENVGWYDDGGAATADDVARLVHDGWMDSTGHRQNLLSPEFTHLGVGVAVGAHGWYLTQNFAAY